VLTLVPDEAALDPCVEGSAAFPHPDHIAREWLLGLQSVHEIIENTQRLLGDQIFNLLGIHFIRRISMHLAGGFVKKDKASDVVVYKYTSWTGIEDFFIKAVRKIIHARLVVLSRFLSICNTYSNVWKSRSDRSVNLEVVPVFLTRFVQPRHKAPRLSD
jgi:hypothetical protein